MFDLLVVLVVGLSTAFAALRGGLRELATLIALAIAGGLTLMLIEPILSATGLSGSFFGTAIIAAILVAVFFVLAHIGLHLGLKRVPLEGRARLIDRAGGGVFGLLRGLALIGLGYLGYTYYLDEARQPDEVKNAITRPIAAGVANMFESLAPASSKIENIGDEAPADDVDASISGYDRGDRNGLSEIVTTVTTTDDAVIEPTETEPQSDDDPIADILIEDDSQ